MTAPLELRFVLSADRCEALPPSPAELAVVGRSNVGKSSLLNALAQHKGLAKTSSTPGRTQLLNCFELAGAGATVVDCPGYGYAAIPKTQRAAVARMVDRYLLEREALRRVLVLVDGEVGPTALDTRALAQLRDEGLTHSVVATKHDKVKPSQRDRRRRELAQRCGLDPAEVVWASATTGTGIDRLRTLVRAWLAR